jgi:S-adenosyl methyltransferase
MTGTEVPGEPDHRGPAPAPATKLDPGVAHIARVRDYWLGGRDNFAADRQVGGEALAAFPGLVGSVRTTRAFLGRAVRYLTAQAGVRQFLDIGAGIPTANSTHEVAQSIAPDALVCYVDRDPVVFGHARALLASGRHGRTSYLEADLRDTGKILAEAASTLDLTQPVAVLLNAVLQFIPDQAGPGEIVTTLLDAMPPGSYLVLSHPASDLGSEPRPDPASPLGRLLAQPVTRRSHQQVSRFFCGLRLLPPGVVRLPEWRPDPADLAGPVAGLASGAAAWGGAGQK